MTSTYKEVSEWNLKCGNHPSTVGSEPYWNALTQQIARIEEELAEVKEAVAKRDLDNLIKEGCDLDVTVSGFNFLLNVDYETAIGRVLVNNDEKVTLNIHKADQWRDHYTSLKVMVCINTSSFGEDLHYCVKRIEDDKVMKPPSLSKVDLSSINKGVN